MPWALGMPVQLLCLSSLGNSLSRALLGCHPKVCATVYLRWHVMEALQLAD